MFDAPDLKEHIDTSSVIKVRSLVSAEINMNIASNINTIGNYRYRPAENLLLEPENRSIYSTLINSFDPNDDGQYYTGATDADAVVDGGFDDDGIPLAFKSSKDKEKILYSLEDCFGKFRPRSGINKLRYFSDRHTHFANSDMSKRPRYYLSHSTDKFKYWSSYRTESLRYEYVYANGDVGYGTNPEYLYEIVDGNQVIKRGRALSAQEVGISNVTVNGNHYISDAAPFVKYENEVPANRVIVKMQTGVGTFDLGPFGNSAEDFDDPFFGYDNQLTPTRWKIQGLANNVWSDLISFDESSERESGLPVIGPEGYVEIAYGLKVPFKYKSVFFHSGEYISADFLPDRGIQGQAYLVKSSDIVVGTYYIWYNDSYEQFTPEYDWFLKDPGVSSTESFVADLTSPAQFTNPTNGLPQYREFEYLSGVRVVVETMNKENATFDLIELSPRLAIDLSDKVSDYSVVKQMSDIGISGLPVGQLLAGTGTLALFDYDRSFFKSNEESIIADYIGQNIQIKFYEVVSDVDGYDYFVPIKTMYAEGFPEVSNTDRSVSLTLRDLFFYFESLTAPELLLVNASLSSAVSTLLDNVGFSNYVFLRTEEDEEPIIPYFFVAPDKSVAEILNDLAISTQYAMFFDEYNNLIVMSKNYVLPTEAERDTDLVLNGSRDTRVSGVLENESYGDIANIIDISSQTNSVYNDGQINYVSRYIQRSYSSIRQASVIDRDKTWIYKPALLWEVSGTEQTKTINEASADQSNYLLSAIPLNTDLTDELPYVDNREILNNIMDLGEGVYWIARYKGFFYANGEIIKYDAVQYSVQGLTEADGVDEDGTVWITSNQEYQKFFAKLPFNGKMYPTGLVRIYVEPNYEVVNGLVVLSNGVVAKHGRGQFATPVVYHNAGLASYWSDSQSLRGCRMDSRYLFTSGEFTGTLQESAAGVQTAAGTTRNGIIKNFLAGSFPTEAEANRLYSTQTGTIQSSALVMTGKTFASTEKPIDFVAYSYKPLTDSYKHFGTRMRIIGRIQSGEGRIQSPSGSNSYYTIPGTTPDESITVGAASGGLAVMVNPETNVGYYFEISALTENNLEQYQETGYVNNVMFYKVMSSPGNSSAIPVKLWGGLAQILVDDGNFTGQYRVTGDSQSTVYDLAVEYKDIGGIRRFYLYINNNLVATVDDEDPLTNTANMALFVRGNARCMFENIYAITKDYAENSGASLDLPANEPFNRNELTVNDSFRKYAMSGVVQSTYLSSISPNEPPKYNMYFEEFGTIMREAAYFNVKYNKAFPALYAQLSPTFNKIKGYTVSGFVPSAYGAEFLVFNSTDTALNLDETSGNYLRIQGITFTQESENELTVDEYFTKKSDLSRGLPSGQSEIDPPTVFKRKYFDIKTSRLTYGKNEFSLNAPYIQSQDDAESLMGWMVDKVMKPRLSIGVSIFANPMIQLGDILTVNYKDISGADQLVDSTSRFVVYNIEYARSKDGPEMTLYLSEVGNA